VSRNGGRISQTSRVIVNYLLKFSNFRCHGNRGCSGTNFSSTVKFADPDNPLLGPGMGVVSPIQAELLPFLCQYFRIFVAMATGVGLAQISLAQLNSPTPITTYTRSRNGGRISHTSRVIANFGSKFSNFRCRGNRGWSGTNFTSTVKFADPDNPLLGPGMGVVSPIQVELLPILCSNNVGWLPWQQGSARGKFGGHH